MHWLWRFASIFLCALIFLLLITLRFVQLGKIPQGINVDEASYGYDAYSLLKTGKDVWGEQHMSLKSFGDYKPAGLAYTLIPVIHQVGLSTFTTRLPSAIFGVLTLIMTFFLLRLLSQRALIAVLGTLILGVSPWHFGLSRLFYEPNIGLFFIVVSIYAELRYLRATTDKKYLIIAAVAIALGGYYYAVLRYLGLATLLITILVAHLPQYRKVLTYSVFVGLIWALCAAPYLPDMWGSRGLIRLKQENAIQTVEKTLVITENRQMCYLSSGKNTLLAKWCYVLWNKPGEKVMATAKVYIELLSPKYLFLTGSQKDILPENTGAFIEMLIPLYILGLYTLIHQAHAKQKAARFILTTFLCMPVPIAVVGTLTIHRNVVGLYLVFLVCMFGLIKMLEIINTIPKVLVQRIILACLVSLFVWSQSRYLAQYFYVYTRVHTEVWMSDAPEVMKWLGEHRGERKINSYDFDFAPLLYAFYTQYDPRDFQKNAHWSSPNQYGWQHVDELGNTLQNYGSMWEIICLHQVPGVPSHLLVIQPQAPWESVMEQQFRDFTQVYVTREIYDSQVLYTYLKQHDAVNLALRCKTPAL